MPFLFALSVRRNQVRLPYYQRVDLRVNKAFIPRQPAHPPRGQFRAGAADGQRRLYSLRPEQFRKLDAWVANYRTLWEARLDRFGKAVEQTRSARTATRKEMK